MSKAKILAATLAMVAFAAVPAYAQDAPLVVGDTETDITSEVNDNNLAAQDASGGDGGDATATQQYISGDGNNNVAVGGDGGDGGEINGNAVAGEDNTVAGDDQYLEDEDEDGVDNDEDGEVDEGDEGDDAEASATAFAAAFAYAESDGEDNDEDGETDEGDGSEAEAEAAASAEASSNGSSGGAGELPATGGVSLLTLGAGALLVAGGLVARRIVR